jgi:hypothetical protein
MARATISDVNLFLDDFVNGERKALLSQAPCGRTYTVLLTGKHQEIQKLPPALIRARPLADELDSTDEVHDGYGSFMWYSMNGYVRLPEDPPEVVQEAKQVMTSFIPELAELKASYADEASKAAERLPKLKEHEAILRKFPVRGDRTLYDIVEKFLQAGVRLSGLLSERAKLNAEKLENIDEDQSSAVKLLGETMRLIKDCRASLANDLKVDANLPRNLDALVFGFLDELITRREEARRTKQLAAQEKKAKEKPTPTEPGKD